MRLGDTLSLRLTVEETEAERSDRGLVKTRIEVLRGVADADGENGVDGGDRDDGETDAEVVCSMVALTLFARREDGTEGENGDESGDESGAA
ncbi:hypothetical protein NDI76_10000 [Halogeometricum sp. S1BR25-6]|uniref:Uncharacterized protein n=1 Tax=Halogeometricum salsisoli TaxID=2950536 RepID=A0ABU2GE43_9EURY|nr:hypothetical protein [Halogeometricum sp. S1BR25-6]MDS0299075.1 hypothetical protein [Halogeometricum sp. S1BR25-6]